jgi:hypothetical protein
MKLKACEYCKTNFYTRTDLKRFCSSLCATRNNKNRQALTDLACLECGSIFAPKNIRQLYCTPDCKRKNNKLNASMKEKKRDYYRETQDKVKEKKQKLLDELVEMNLLSAEEVKVPWSAPGEGMKLVTKSQLKSMREENALVMRAVINIWKKSPDMEKYKIEGLNPEINFKQFPEYPSNNG